MAKSDKMKRSRIPVPSLIVDLLLPAAVDCCSICRGCSSSPNWRFFSSSRSNSASTKADAWDEIMAIPLRILPETTNLPFYAIGVMLPKPTVIKVVKIKYKAVK